jgi:hypothetical protein
MLQKSKILSITYHFDLITLDIHRVDLLFFYIKIEEIFGLKFVFLGSDYYLIYLSENT